MKVISGLKELELMVKNFVCFGDTFSAMRAPRRSVHLTITFFRYHERNHVRETNLSYL